MLCPLVGTPRALRLCPIRDQLKRLADHAEGGEDARALGWRARVDHRGELGPGESSVDVGGILKPLCDVGGRRLEREQTREHPSWSFDEESVVPTVLRKERLRERKRFRLVLNFVARRP